MKIQITGLLYTHESEGAGGRFRLRAGGTLISQEPIELGTKVDYVDIRLQGLLITEYTVDGIYRFEVDNVVISNPVADEVIEKEFGELLASVKKPNIGDLYRHHNGNEYLITDLANVDSTRPEYPVTIVYMGRNEKVWAKTLHNFVQKMTFVRALTVSEAINFVE